MVKPPLREVRAVCLSSTKSVSDIFSTDFIEFHIFINVFSHNFFIPNILIISSPSYYMYTQVLQ